MTDILEQAREIVAEITGCKPDQCVWPDYRCSCQKIAAAILALAEPKLWPIDDAMVERTAIAIEGTMFAPHELPLDSDLHEKYLHTTRVGLEAAFTQFSLPLPPKEEQR